jgi:hypothetical protein
MTVSRYYSSVARRTTLTSDINSGGTSMQVAAATGFPSTYPYTLIIDQDTVNEEIVEVSARSGTTLTVVRGVDGTSGIAHTAGAAVEHGVSARDFSESRQHEDASENVHGLGSGVAVVGDTAAQTLTNKTLTSPTINGASVTGTVTGGTLSGQTVTSGTLGSDLAAGGFKVTGLADPSSAQDAVTKNWAETGMTSQLTAATTQATNAAASASAASASESAAASSETAAAASESAAATSESNAGTSASAAAASASTASTQASNAASSASSSASSASAADASATAAASSQSAAATSASNAASSASAASGSATSAASSAAAAASALDSFDDRYLGSKASAPTLDNDGDALVQGALFYLNTGTAEQIGMYVYDGSSWLKASAASVASIVTYEYTATSGQTVFAGSDANGVSLSFTADLIQVFLNGVLLSPGDDYTTSTNTVTLISGAAVSDVLLVVAFASFNVANTYTIAEADAAIASATAGLGGATGAGGDQVFYENDQTVTTNYTITTNKNAVTAGPVTINSGVTVTIPSGSYWSVV